MKIPMVCATCHLCHVTGEPAANRSCRRNGYEKSRSGSGSVRSFGSRGYPAEDWILETTGFTVFQSAMLRVHVSFRECTLG